jgi:hypothetical protein
MITYDGHAWLRDGRKLKIEVMCHEDDPTKNVPETREAILDHIGRGKVRQLLIVIPCARLSPEPALG